MMVINITYLNINVHITDAYCKIMVKSGLETRIMVVVDCTHLQFVMVLTYF